MIGRILCPDDHPDRYGPNDSEAFASVARALRDEVLTDPEIARVYVMVGAPGSGKSTWAKVRAAKAVSHPPINRFGRPHPNSGIVVIDACHSKYGPRKALVKRIKAAGKQAVCVRMDTPMGVCRFRQRGRSPKRRVPEADVSRIYHEIVRAPPRMNEGWTEIHTYSGGVSQLAESA